MWRCDGEAQRNIGRRAAFVENPAVDMRRAIVRRPKLPFAPLLLLFSLISPIAKLRAREDLSHKYRELSNEKSNKYTLRVKEKQFKWSSIIVLDSYRRSALVVCRRSLSREIGDFRIGETAVCESKIFLSSRKQISFYLCGKHTVN